MNELGAIPELGAARRGARSPSPRPKIMVKGASTRGTTATSTRRGGVRADSVRLSSKEVGQVVRICNLELSV